jgi:hypothetical protein
MGYWTGVASGSFGRSLRNVPASLFSSTRMLKLFSVSSINAKQRTEPSKRPGGPGTWNFPNCTLQHDRHQPQKHLVVICEDLLGCTSAAMKLCVNLQSRGSDHTTARTHIFDMSQDIFRSNKEHNRVLGAEQSCRSCTSMVSFPATGHTAAPRSADEATMSSHHAEYAPQGRQPQSAEGRWQMTTSQTYTTKDGQVHVYKQSPPRPDFEDPPQSNLNQSSWASFALCSSRCWRWKRPLDTSTFRWWTLLCTRSWRLMKNTYISSPMHQVLHSTWRDRALTTGMRISTIRVLHLGHLVATKSFGTSRATAQRVRVSITM